MVTPALPLREIGPPGGISPLRQLDTQMSNTHKTPRVPNRRSGLRPGGRVPTPSGPQVPRSARYEPRAGESIGTTPRAHSGILVMGHMKS